MKTFYTGILFFIAVVYGDAQIVDGYTDKLSYRSGEIVTFFTKHPTNSTQTSFDLKDFANIIIPCSLSFSVFNATIGNNQPIPSANSYMDGYPYLQTNTWSHFLQ